MSDVELRSVWDFPRPPIVVPDDRIVEVTHRGRTIVRTRAAVTVLETSHPPTFYFPHDAMAPNVLHRSDRTSWCEFKGLASYWDLIVEGVVSPDAAWGYEAPSPGYEALAGRVAFYAGRVDRCTVGGMEVTPQEGGFYGGWVTPDVVGPFKGSPGTSGW